MVPSEGDKQQGVKKYKLVAPEGGWGYIITVAVAVLLVVTVSPLCAFGIIYGNFLSELGNEASNTTLVTCVFNTVLSFMGIVCHRLYQSYSYRKVGIFGSVAFFAGTFLTIFATSLVHIVISFGVLQGMGFGLMVTSALTCFNEYFVVRRNLMMSISQTIIAVVAMLVPLLARYLMDTYGYRGTVAIFSALSLHAFMSMMTLQPVKYHMRKVMLEEKNQNDDNEKYEEVEEIHSFLNDQEQENTTQIEEFIVEDLDEKEKQSKLLLLWKNISDFLVLELIKDPIYMNIAQGLTFAFTADLMFLSVLPMYLTNLNFDKSSVAFLMTLYMACDLIGRILLSIISGVASFKNRTLFLFGTVLTIVFRIGITLADWKYWIASLVVLLGLTRSTIQVLVPLVLAEYTKHKFTASYGMYMSISGITNLVLAPISNAVGRMSTTGVSVVHLLTILLLFCAVPWITEIIILRSKHKRTTTTKYETPAEPRKST